MGRPKTSFTSLPSEGLYAVRVSRESNPERLIHSPARYLYATAADRCSENGRGRPGLEGEMTTEYPCPSPQTATETFQHTIHIISWWNLTSIQTHRRNNENLVIDVFALKWNVAKQNQFLCSAIHKRNTIRSSNIGLSYGFAYYYVANIRFGFPFHIPFYLS